MKITIEIPETVVCGFFSWVQDNGSGSMSLVTNQIGTDDLVDGNTIKLPRDIKEDARWS